MLSKFDSVMTLLGGQPRLVATWRAAATWLCAGPTKISSLMASGRAPMLMILGLPSLSRSVRPVCPSDTTPDRTALGPAAPRHGG
jgi:hypothetical protein